MTVRINLLPWRQWKRERRRRVFFIKLSLACAASTLLIVLAGISLAAGIGNQEERNRFLLGRLAELDIRIHESEVLRRRREGIAGRLDVLVRIGNSRSAAVRVFNELADALVPGVHYISLAKRGSVLAARGVAESNEAVSALMRNLRDSPTFARPHLKRIGEAHGELAEQPSTKFELTFVASGSPQPADSGK